MIEKLRLNRFCSCCTVRTGSLIIGVFGWVGSLLQAITLSTPTETTTTISALNSTLDGSSAIIIEESNGPNVSTILISIFMFCISVCLVVGVYQDNRKLILPWLCIKFLECVGISLATVIFFFLLFVSYNVGVVFVVFLIIGGFSIFAWYCWLCVWSFYMDLGEVMTTVIPVGNSYPMTETMQVQQYPPEYPQLDNMGKENTYPQQQMV